MPKNKTGRKPIQDKKVQITINFYIPQSQADKLDLDQVKEEAKEAVYQIINLKLKEGN